MELLLKVLTDKRTKTAMWQIANGIIVIVIVYLGELNAVYVPVLIAVLNAITKEINKKYL